MHNHGYQTRRTTSSDTEGLANRAATEDEQDDKDENSVIVVDDEDSDGNGNDHVGNDDDDEDSDVVHTQDHKRRYSELDHEEEDGPAHKRMHLNEDE
jgi:hypothetical protein